MVGCNILFMEILLNGKKMEIREETTIGELLALHKLTPVRVAVERNGEIVRRADFYTVRLAPQDQIEVVTLVGGG